ncbi:MAG: transglycosylase SLT domain-containing protein [Actinomycetota bacterium]
MAIVGKAKAGCLAGLLLAGLPAAGAEASLHNLLSEARSYEHGEGVRKDAGRAMQLYCEGARRGDAEAQYSLGWMYANGRGTERDDRLAAYFFGLASRQGHPQAQRMLRYVGLPASHGPDCLALRYSTAGAAEGDVLLARTPSERKVVDLVQRLAPQYGISPRLALAVIRAESNFDTRAVSRRNAQGLMQLIPETSARFNVARPFDPEQNIRGGLAYLRWLLAYFKGNVPLVAAAYNAGEGAVNRFRGIPPFAETRDYVKRIRKLYARDEHPYDESVTAPSPELPKIRISG